MRKILRERSRNPNREVWESPSVLRRRGCQEIYESDLVINRGFSQQQAHLLAQKQYPWSDSIQQTR
ncbi:DNA-cytosine methyltransferase [Microcystis sp. 0824]|nr:DNA-cytosine methyltransferase [Microcystis sp. 0824]